MTDRNGAGAAALETALEAVRRRKDDEPESFEGAAVEEALQAAEARLGVPLPGAWKDVLRVSRSFAVTTADDDAFAALDPEGLVISRRDGDSAEGPYVEIGDALDSDVIVLELGSAGTDGDCPVLRIDGAEGKVAARWSGVAAFLRWVFGPAP